MWKHFVNLEKLHKIMRKNSVKKEQEFQKEEIKEELSDLSNSVSNSDSEDIRI